MVERKELRRSLAFSYWNGYEVDRFNCPSNSLL